jgi:hypothetical protein
MVSKVDHTVDYGFKSWPYCRLCVQKLTILTTVEISKTKIATVATSRLSIFRGFYCGFFIGFQWESGRIRTKWPQNLQKFPSKSTVDYVSEILQQLTFLEKVDHTVDYMVSKVDHTVDYGFKSWPYCRLWFQKLTGLSTSQKKSNDCRLLKKKSCNSRFMTKSRLSTLRLGSLAHQYIHTLLIYIIIYETTIIA